MANTRPRTEQEKQHLRDLNLGKKQGEATKAKKRAALLGKPHPRSPQTEAEKNHRSQSLRRRFSSGQAARHQILATYKKDATRRGKKWLLTDYGFDRLTRGPCYYCGMLFSNECIMGAKSARGGNGSFLYNGIDRVDNEKDYTVENSVSCCKDCNRMKGKLSLDDFLSHIVQIVRKRVALITLTEDQQADRISALVADLAHERTAVSGPFGINARAAGFAEYVPPDPEVLPTDFLASRTVGGPIPLEVA